MNLEKLCNFNFSMNYLSKCLLAVVLTFGVLGSANAQVEIRAVSLQSARQAEQQAIDALTYAEKVVQMAQDLKDADALAVANEAADTANAALKKAIQHRRNLENITHSLKQRQKGAETGTASKLQGDVYIRTDAGDLKIDPGFIIQQGDMILTGHQSGIEINLSQGSKILLGANSSFTAAQMDGDYTFSQVFGRLKAWVVGMKQGGHRFSVITSHCAIGVRGTEFEVNATTATTTVTVRSGKVEAKPTNGEPIMVNAGWRFHVGTEGQGSLESLESISFFTPYHSMMNPYCRAET